MKNGIKLKLIVSFLFVSAILAVVGANGYFSLIKVDATYTLVSDNDMPSVIALGDAVAEAKGMVIKSFILARMAAPASEDVAKVEGQIKEEYAIVEKSSDDFLKANQVEATKEKWKAVMLVTTEIHERALKVAALSHSAKPDDLAARDKVVTDILDSNKRFLSAASALHEELVKDAKENSDAADKTVSRATFTILFGIAAGFVVSMLLAFFLARYLSNALSGVAEKLSLGSGEVAKASQQISSAGTELSASATEQAAALQQTVASLEEVSAMVNKNAENARRSLETSTAGQDIAKKGQAAVGAMIVSIQEISTSNAEIMHQIDASNKEMAEIVKVIAEIGTKTKVINDIVFQTKLLSFNASVEAARAGEHGKGFAVVAEEVGNLAQMSGNAAKEISAMLDGSIQKVEAIVQNTKSRVEGLVITGKEKVSAGAQTANQCGEILSEIVTKVSEINQMVGEISTASREQAQGVQEINKAMSQLDQVTQQNAAASLQSADAADSLMVQTGELEGLVAGLRTIVTGEKNPHAALAPAYREKSDNNVVNLPKRPKNARTPTAMKQAVGAEHFPSQDDPRFDDV